MQLRFSPGNGRLLRHGPLMAFLSEPNEEITTFLRREIFGGTKGSGADGELFKRLSALVVKRGFNLPPFVVARTAQPPQVFVYGEIGVSIGLGHRELKPSSAFTWIERTLTPYELGQLALSSLRGKPVNAETAPSDCHLDQGTVPASSFLLELANPNEASSAPANGHASAPESNGSEMDAISSSATMHFKPGAEWPIPAAEAAEEVPGPPPLPGSPPAHTDLLAEAAPKPPDTPSDSGVQTAPGLAPEPPPSLMDGPMASSAPLTSSSLGRPETAPGLPGQTMAAPPASDTAPRPAVLIRLDDGQGFRTDSNVYVGRYPSKHGLPSGYDEIIVSGQHVSRIHWELVVDGPHLSIADLGSTTGTAISAPGQADRTRLSAAELIPIESGTTVYFGDRWAHIEVETDSPQLGHQP